MRNVQIQSTGVARLLVAHLLRVNIVKKHCVHSHITHQSSKMKAKKPSNRIVARADPKGFKLQPLDKKEASNNNTSRNTSHRASFAHICSGCKKPIKKDKFLLKACDKYWHENCLRCDRCHSRLGELGSTLYNKSNMNLCRQDYLEMFGETGVCSVCEKQICASEMVMKAKQNVYHLECFACQLCNQRFCVGDRFYLWENKVVCQYDYEEHILPIKRSSFEPPDRSSGDNQQQYLPDNFESRSMVNTSNSLISVHMDSTYAIPNNEHNLVEIGDYQHGEMEPSGVKEDLKNDAEEEVTDETPVLDRENGALKMVGTNGVEVA